MPRAAASRRPSAGATSRVASWEETSGPSPAFLGRNRPSHYRRAGIAGHGDIGPSHEDEGPGIGKEILERVFNPFFTTKDTGTGLGLAIVHRVVEAHDGTITVTNRESGGARFEIRV